MLISLVSLKNVLQNSVCEIKFIRRRPRPGRPMSRRMLCTNASQVLNSVDGRVTLNYRPAGQIPKFNPNEKNLVIAWDILMQNYRCISCERCDLITTIPAGEPFWKYFRENLARLTSTQKMMYMDS